MEPSNSMPPFTLYLETFERVPHLTQFAYGIGHLLNDIFASIWFFYMRAYLHLVLKFNNCEAGLFLLAGQVVDAISTPFIGYGSDQSAEIPWISKYGPRRVWHLMGTALTMLSFPFLFIPWQPDNEGTLFARICYYGSLIVIFKFGWASVQISHLSLIPEITPNENDRVKLGAIRYAFTIIANILVCSTAWRFFGEGDFPIGPPDAATLEYMALIGVWFGALCSTIYYAVIFKRDEDGNVITEEQSRIRNRRLFRNHHLYQVGSIYIFTSAFVNVVQVCTPRYMEETLSLSASNLTLINLIMHLGSLTGCSLVGKLNKWFGRKAAFIMGTVVGLIACFWMKYSSVEQMFNFNIYIIAAMLGVSSSIVLVTSLTMTADLIDDDTGSSAFIYGIMSFTEKIASGIAIAIIENKHQIYQSDIYYENIIFYVCGGFIMFAGAILLRSYPCRFDARRFSIDMDNHFDWIDMEDYYAFTRQIYGKVN